jgi:hypothetical protein
MAERVIMRQPHLEHAMPANPISSTILSGSRVSCPKQGWGQTAQPRLLMCRFDAMGIRLQVFQCCVGSRLSDVRRAGIGLFAGAEATGKQPIAGWVQHGGCTPLAWLDYHAFSVEY